MKGNKIRLVLIVILITCLGLAGVFLYKPIAKFMGQQQLKMFVKEVDNKYYGGVIDYLSMESSGSKIGYTLKDNILTIRFGKVASFKINIKYLDKECLELLETIHFKIQKNKSGKIRVLWENKEIDRFVD